MQLTNEKIEVTDSMMRDNNMMRGNQFGIPVDLNNLSKGLKWKGFLEMTDQDFDTLEAYFLMKSGEVIPSNGQ